MQTGYGISIFDPVGFSFPLSLLILKVKISLVSWLAANKKFPFGSNAKFLGVSPNVD